MLYSSLIILFSLIFVSKEECSIQNDQNSVACENTSSEEYLYDISKTLYSVDAFVESGFCIIKNISITNSNFRHVKELPNPIGLDEFFVGKIDVLEIKCSAIETIESDAFSNFPDLTVLDLSYNKIRKISVAFSSSLRSVKNLILSHNQIDIEHIDNTESYSEAGSLVDLSHNKIKSLKISCHVKMIQSGGNKHSVPIFLNLAYNEMNNILFDSNGCIHYSVNLAGNDNLSLAWNRSGSRLILNSINLSFSTRIKDNLSSIRVSNVFNMSNSKIFHLDNNFTNKQCLDVLDLTNSSLTNIDEGLFDESIIDQVLLGDNNLRNLSGISIFRKAVITYLDISSSQLKNISNLFDELWCRTLILRNNSIDILSPQDFGEITSVEKLDLSFNKLHQLSNGSFSNCKGLKVLNISHNELVSVDLLAFHNLQDLEVLELSYNKIQQLNAGVFSDLQKLKHLNLKKNHVSSVKFGVFENLPIVSLNLGDESLSDIGERAFYNLQRLDKLNSLTVENLSSHAFHSTNLKNFKIKFVNSSIKPKTFFGLSNLKNLTIHNSSIVIENNAFLGLFKLKYLNFPSTNVSKFDKFSFRGLFNLEHLDVKSLYKNIKTIQSGIFDDISSLRNLDLSNLSISKIEPYALQGLRSVQNIALNHNSLGTISNKIFIGLNNLESLNLSFSNISDIEDFSFYHLKNLKVLDFQGNNLKNLSDHKFALDSLELINFANCKISKLSRNIFERLPNLKYLGLRDNLIDQFEDLQVDSFSHIPNLLKLDLAGNFIDDFKVGTFSNLKRLKHLDISNNNVTKFIIETFIPLKSLEELFLDNNHLKTLNILQFLDYAKNLIYIGISQNKLPCDKLGIIIKELRKRSISFEPHTAYFEGDNIEGIECVDVCKFLFCLKDTHGIN